MTDRCKVLQFAVQRVTVTVSLRYGPCKNLDPTSLLLLDRDITALAKRYGVPSELVPDLLHNSKRALGVKNGKQETE